MRKRYLLVTLSHTTAQDETKIEKNEQGLSGGRWENEARSGDKSKIALA